ncbi:MAG: phosphate ABC transporter substrate-binding protein [Coriobacteriia bacterium]|nr:phosphate ABC transporter substrate-binding protein [Coriobacteriia bacterium]
MRNLKLQRVIIASVVALSFCQVTACDQESGSRVIIAGSTSVQPYIEILAEAYAIERPEIEIDVQGGGSSAGITAAMSKTADIGMSSRVLKDEEQDLWSIEIAKDGLAIIINPNNPINDLSLEQVCEIYTQGITNWSEVGWGTTKQNNTKIHIITREDGSGTRSAFEELVMEGKQISPRAIVQDSNGAVRQLVADDPNAIGFISLGLVENGEKPVKALSLDGVYPTHENVVNGQYQLTRPFLLIAFAEPTGAADEFIQYIMSEPGREILRSEGLIVE